MDNKSKIIKGVYKFECNAPRGWLYYYSSSDGKVDGLYTGKGQAKPLGFYHPCSKKHEASTTDPFYDGFVDYNENGNQDPNEGVIVWIERRGWSWDAHATKDLKKDTWEKAKS
ncbi:hypothetical protein HF855_09375 [Dorea formicigenerans]|uniref:Uncharacterized protein n=1 Tax=Dorea formicigenerans TaxID=39486 RepID=A0A848CRL9_9FIRM|nr:hypothetical protein [Dorea formicigenerans]NME57621.1 hypothetical protein [Dorea formicigenerans]